MKQFLLMPFGASPLMLVALFSVLGWILQYAGYIGVAIAVILASWFFKYCFVLLDAVVAGEREAPVLDIEMVNPLAEQRPLAQLLVIGAGCAVARLALLLAGLPGLFVCGALLLAALPASVAVLGLTRNPLRAASPVALAKLVRALGGEYLWLVLATLLFGAGLYGLIRPPAHLGLFAPLAQLGLLFLFALIGAVIHQNRHQLGITTRTLAERRAERERIEHARERKRMLEHSFNELRLGRTAEAWRDIERWIEAHARGPNADAEYGALLDSALAWHPPSLGDRLTCEYLSRLLAMRETGRALEVLERRLASNPRFRPSSPDQARRLRELAALAGKRGLSRLLDT
jgi:hypothetical protein